MVSTIERPQVPGRPMKSFAVVRIADMYTITVEGRRWGRFGYRVDAEEAAIRLAEKARAAGARVEVLVQGPLGEVEPLRLPAQGA
jgi:hypothetical protein